MKKNALTLTVVANMTSNYSEGLGNIASVQKVFKNRKVYTIRSRESLKLYEYKGDYICAEEFRIFYRRDCL